MRMSNIKYFLREGILNTYRNKLMSLASISIVAASLIVFGIFLIMSTNLNYNAFRLESRNEIIVTCNYDLDDSQVEEVEKKIQNVDRIKSCQIITKKEAFENVKQTFLADSKEALEGLTEDFLPVCFKVNINKVQNSDSIIHTLKNISGVKSVRSWSKEMEMLVKITKWLKYGSIMLILVLTLISIAIISNTIKMAVFARRSEINIMKYIGATNWFVRWPFIIEGILIGTMGAIFALVIIAVGYKYILGTVHFNIAIIKFISLKDMLRLMIPGYLTIGPAVGALSSLISVHKHLHV